MSDELINMDDLSTEPGASPDVATLVVTEVVTEVAAAPSVLIKCHTCQKMFPRKGSNSKFCDECQPEQKKARNQKRVDKKKATSFVYDSATEPTKPEAKRLLEERGLKNAHIIDLCYDLGLVAAEQNSVPANRFLFQNGIRRMLESYQCKAPKALDLIPGEEIAGELLNRAELFALYDFGFWRQPDVSFDQWLAGAVHLSVNSLCLWGHF